MGLAKRGDRVLVKKCQSVRCMAAEAKTWCCTGGSRVSVGRLRAGCVCGGLAWRSAM